MDKLPTELLTIIGQSATIGSIAALARTCRRHYDILNTILYQRNATEDHPKHSCLLWAAERGNVQTLALGFAQGADLDVNGSRLGDECYRDREIRDTKFFATPLHRAVQNGHHDTVRWLLNKGAKVHVESVRFCACKLKEPLGSWAPYWYPLHSAIFHSDEEMVGILLSHRARFASSRIPALHNAAASGSIPKINQILDLPDVNPAGSSRLNTVALHHVAQCTIEDEEAVSEVVRTLVRRGVPVDQLSIYGSPLYVILLENRFEVALTLLDLGAPVETDRDPIEYRDGLHLLHQCLTYENVNPRTTGRPSESARCELVRRLISKGIDIEAPSGQGLRRRKMPLDSTALFFAAAYARSIDCVKLLLEAGANVRASVVDPQGNEQSILRGLFRIADRLNDDDLENRPPDHRPFEPSSDLVCLLLSYGAVIHSITEDESVLMYACERSKQGDHDLLRLFAEHASDDTVVYYNPRWIHAFAESKHGETRGILAELISKLHRANTSGDQ